MLHTEILTSRQIGLFSVLLAFVLLTFGCSLGGAPALTRSSQALPKALLALEGTYVRETASGDYVFTAKHDLERILEPVKPDERVRILVDCLDDQTPSRVTLDRKPVALGVLCYQGLSQTAYYEPSDTKGDLVGWAGNLKLPARAGDLRKAKEAWLKVVATSSYVLL